MHFLAIGGLLFGVYASVNDSVQSVDESNIISIGPQRIERIKAGFSAVWNRSPTAEELETLIENQIREEVYYRDALALGLDTNDVVVKKRMRQKLEFLSDTSVYMEAPSDEELEAFYQAKQSDYQRDPLLAFEQIYLGENPSSETIQRILNRLLTEPVAAPLALGEPSLLPAQLRLSRPGAINNIFGAGFFQQLSELAPGIWGGPVTSAYGIHLVRTLDGEPARMPSMDDIRNTVLKDFQASKLKQARKQDYARRRSRFEIEVQDGDSF